MVSEGKVKGVEHRLGVELEEASLHISIISLDLHPNNVPSA